MIRNKITKYNNKRFLNEDVTELDDYIYNYLKSRYNNTSICLLAKQIPNPSNRLKLAILKYSKKVEDLLYIHDITEDDVILFIRSNKSDMTKYMVTKIKSHFLITEKIQFELDMCEIKKETIGLDDLFDDL